MRVIAAGATCWWATWACFPSKDFFSVQPLKFKAHCPLHYIRKCAAAMSHAQGNVKVLLAGDVNGKIDALFKRVNSVNASNGPFDLLLCVGSFFGYAGMYPYHHYINIF